MPADGATATPVGPPSPAHAPGVRDANAGATGAALKATYDAIKRDRHNNVARGILRGAKAALDAKFGP